MQKMLFSLSPVPGLPSFPRFSPICRVFRDTTHRALSTRPFLELGRHHERFFYCLFITCYGLSCVALFPSRLTALPQEQAPPLSELNFLPVISPPSFLFTNCLKISQSPLPPFLSSALCDQSCFRSLPIGRCICYSLCEVLTISFLPNPEIQSSRLPPPNFFLNYLFSLSVP